MSLIDINGITPIPKLFHDEKIATYVTVTSWHKISYWEENLRTILAFDRIQDSTGKKLSQISLEEITKYLASRPEVRLTALARSIRKNGVRVPLVVLTDGTLLDGNRRFFACALLHQQYGDDLAVQDVLSKIPVWVIDSQKINEIQKQKVLAEANFLPDYKVEWTLDVKAYVISNYFKEFVNKGGAEEEAYIEIQEVYGLKKSAIKAYIETIELAEEYIARADGDRDNKFKLREQVLNKFVYFWEFRNKALNGRSALKESELPEVKPLFFKMMENNRFKNIKQVEPMIKSVRHPHVWDVIVESKGSKMEQAEVLYREIKAIRSDEDKVRNFHKWLINHDSESFNERTYDLLKNLNAAIGNILDPS